MSITPITTNDLRRMEDQEGLILRAVAAIPKNGWMGSITCLRKLAFCKTAPSLKRSILSSMSI